MQHLTFKRSDVAHGRIRSIDTSAAEAMDGVAPSALPAIRSRWWWPATATWRATRPTPSRGRLRAPAGGGRSGDSNDRPAGGTAGRLPEQRRPRPAAERYLRRSPGGHRRHRRRGGGRDDRPADGKPAAGAELHRGARRGGALRAGPRDAEHLVVDPESTHPAHLPGADARPGAGPRAGHRPGGGRRLWRQDQHLRRKSTSAPSAAARRRSAGRPCTMRARRARPRWRSGEVRRGAARGARQRSDVRERDDCRQGGAGVSQGVRRGCRPRLPPVKLPRA